MWKSQTNEKNDWYNSGIYRIKYRKTEKVKVKFDICKRKDYNCFYIQ